MAKGGDICLCIDSFNRDIDRFPEPNDFALELHKRYPIHTISLGSCELPPQAQWTVEEAWSAFAVNFGEGFSTLSGRSLSYRWGGEASFTTACVLPTVSEKASSTDGEIWKTVSFHGLTRSFLTLFPGRARVAFFDATAGANIFASIIDIEDSTTLRTAPTGGENSGFLTTSVGSGTSFFTPGEVAVALNGAFSDNMIPVSVEYRHSSMSFILRFRTSQPFEIAPPPYECTRSTGILSVLQFPSRNSNLSSVDMECISGTYPPAERTLPVRIPPGMYDPPSLRSALSLAVGGGAQLDLTGSDVVFTVSVFPDGGDTVTFTVGADPPWKGRRYANPHAFAKEAQKKMRDAFVLLPGMEGTDFEFRYVADRFRVTSSDPFQLDFQSSPEVAAKLGFPSYGPTPVPPGDLSQSERRVYSYYPHADSSVRCCFSPCLTFPQILRTQSASQTKRFLFGARAPSLVPVGAAVEGGLLHTEGEEGMCIGELVDILDGDTVVGLGRITTPPDPCSDAVYVDPASEVPAVEPDRLRVRLRPTPGAVPIVNFFFAGFSGVVPTVSRLGEILGFPPGATLWPVERGSPAPVLVAPQCWCFDGVPYVLLDLGLQHASSNNVQWCGNDVRSSFLCKIILAPFRVERNYPMYQIGTSTAVYTYFHVRILNPDGTLYCFHGRNWSATLNVQYQRLAPQSDCPGI